MKIKFIADVHLGKLARLLRMLGFDTEHTRFASKYNLFLYREEGVDPYTQENIGVRIACLHLVDMSS